MWEIDRKVQVFIILFAAALLFAGGYKYASRSGASAVPELAVVEAGDPKEAEEDELAVHVAGAVKSPGVYYLKPGDRVKDAVQQAVPLPDAELNSLNLARRVTDGEKIYVPKHGEAAAVGESSMGQGIPAQQGETGGKININTASATELDTLPGIGPSLAARIIDYREKSGPFKSTEDIQKVSGIGARRYEQLKDLIAV